LYFINFINIIIIINCKLLEFQVIYKIYLLEIKFIEIELSLKIHRLHDSFRNLYQYFQNQALCRK
jgi:hypothetical protein